jgi:predicted kinase/SAM-dependent methyltransferase
MSLRLSDPCLVVLIGASGSGKSSLARRHFGASEVVSSDLCRALVAGDEIARDADEDTFAVVHAICSARLRGGLLTVLDATNLHAASRRAVVGLARDHGRPAVALVLDLPEAVCQERNRARGERGVGPHVVRHQQRLLRRAIPELREEGFAEVVLLEDAAAVEALRVERAARPGGDAPAPPQQPRQVAADAGEGGPGYALDLTAAERTRYRFMAQRAVRLEGDRWRRHGVVPGARVADVGCGPGAVLVELARLVGDAGAVVGVEPGAEARAAAAEAIAAAGLANAEVIDGRADATGLVPGSQDVVMVRLVLFHVGAGAQAAVDHLATRVRPGGHLYLVDVDVTGVRMSRDDPDILEGAERYREFQRRRGCDVTIGPRLGSLLLAAGLDLVDRDAVIHVVPREVLALGGALAASQREMLAAGAATEEDVMRWTEARRRMVENPDAAMFIPSYIAVGRRPG